MFFFLNFFKTEVKEYLVKLVVELILVSVEEVRFSNLYFVITLIASSGGYARVSINRRHRVLKNS